MCVLIRHIVSFPFFRGLHHRPLSSLWPVSLVLVDHWLASTCLRSSAPQLLLVPGGWAQRRLLSSDSARAAAGDLEAVRNQLVAFEKLGGLESNLLRTNIHTLHGACACMHVCNVVRRTHGIVLGVSFCNVGSGFSYGALRLQSTERCVNTSLESC